MLRIAVIALVMLAFGFAVQAQQAPVVAVADQAQAIGKTEVPGGNRSRLR